jgi:hypothetical protein
LNDIRGKIDSAATPEKNWGHIFLYLNGQKRNICTYESMPYKMAKLIKKRGE